jgi:hypothetical protein
MARAWSRARDVPETTQREPPPAIARCPLARSAADRRRRRFGPMECGQFSLPRRPTLAIPRAFLRRRSVSGGPRGVWPWQTPNKQNKWYRIVHRRRTQPMADEEDREIQAAFQAAQRQWIGAIRAHRLAPPDAAFSARLAALAGAAHAEAEICRIAHAKGTCGRGTERPVASRHTNCVPTAAVVALRTYGRGSTPQSTSSTARRARQICAVLPRRTRNSPSPPANLPRRLKPKTTPAGSSSTTSCAVALDLVSSPVCFSGSGVPARGRRPTTTHGRRNGHGARCRGERVSPGSYHLRDG